MGNAEYMGEAKNSFICLIKIIGRRGKKNQTSKDNKKNW